ncbi:hypothetical protein D9756_005670 [Leucocoprinus leucothites]|uniref:Cation efflux protein transmembrane domain-containing protein n=1 Tax=Leucocoprinus leucothites TaxID=201217 RepID=A0A8H5D8N3_9AGAR|nr:hypothetical protein D9756_005670 [Leucoagaricus leucothites]
MPILTGHIYIPFKFSYHHKPHFPRSRCSRSIGLSIAPQIKAHSYILRDHCVLMKNTTRIGIVLGITLAFFIVELTVGFKTQSLALIADALHYFTYVVAYTIAFIAAYFQDRGEHTSRFTFIFNRAELVGTFFNGAFLLALALSIFLQSLERFAHVEVIEEPFWVLITGCVGLALNTICALVIYGIILSLDSECTAVLIRNAKEHHDDQDGEHGQQTSIAVPEPEVNSIGDTLPSNIHAKHNHNLDPPVTAPRHNLGLLGVLIHILGDALNNIGVIIAAFIMWKKNEPQSSSRFYADPVASTLISLVIFTEAIHLSKLFILSMKRGIHTKRLF